MSSPHSSKEAIENTILADSTEDKTTNGPHPLIETARRARDASDEALEELLAQIKKPPDFLTTVAINLWSPYLPYGRHTALDCPRNGKGHGTIKQYAKGELKILLGRYFSLLGRNISINHLILEIENVDTLAVDATEVELEGPRVKNIKRGRRIDLSLPLKDPSKDPCFRKLVPKGKLQKWKRWLENSDYESRFENLLREELGQCRREARKILSKAFVDHLSTWIRNGWVPETVGLRDFDDRWLSRVQLTALASDIWGPIWITRALSLGHPAQKKLELLASCTVTGVLASENTKEQLEHFAARCKTRLEKFLKEKLQSHLDHLHGLEHTTLEKDIEVIGNGFSGILGRDLIGSDHEKEPIKLRGLLTQGLDALKRLSPTQLKVLYEIKEADLDESIDDYWGLWRAFFRSNDLFLANDRVALQFELDLLKNRLVPVPRHVVELAGSINSFIEDIGHPSTGLLHLAFETDSTTAFHVRSVRGKPSSIHRRVQSKRKPFKWDLHREIDNQEVKFADSRDWSVLSTTLYKILTLIRDQTKNITFLKSVSKSLSNLSAHQIDILTDGIAELCRLGRGCLVFIGPICSKPEIEGGLTEGTGMGIKPKQLEDCTNWFYEPRGDHSHLLEITRLGICLPIVSQAPESFSEEFRSRFADLAGMDGETVISTSLKPKHNSAKQRRRTPYPDGFLIYHSAGSILGRQFVQLPEGTPPLIDMHKPKILRAYDESWERSSASIKKAYLEELISPGLRYKLISSDEMNDECKLKKSDLLSLGTRHRKAAMTTMCSPSIIAITSSASGNVRVWVQGVPLVELKPEKDVLLRYLSKPRRRTNVKDKY